MRARLAALDAQERDRRSRAASDAAARDPAFERARSVLLYDALPDEADPAGLLVAAFEAGKRVALPRVDWETRTMQAVEIRTPDWWVEGSETRVYLVREPLPGPVLVPARLDLVLVPALAFDRTGRRLGRGKGFYDRFLERVAGSTHRLGFAFGFQMVEEVAAEAHDRRVHAIATDGGLHVVC